MTRIKLMAVAIASLALAACGKGDSTGPATAESGTIVLLNDSSTPIVAVNFSGCDDDSWGPNRLAEAETLAPGALRNWTVEAGCYDLRASTGSRAATWLDRDVPAGGALQLAVPAGVDAMVAQSPGTSGVRVDLKTR
ncbi:MAG TPA: hypothetical protein VFZ26_11735 [Gemmatimonadales bacterium]